MWKKDNNRLKCVTDESRKSFKTYISKTQLEYLHNLEIIHNTYISYLIETGLNNIVLDDQFVFNKKNRLKDKIEIRLTCDDFILKNARTFASDHKINFTDLIQASIEYIVISDLKDKHWRHRIE